MVFKMEPLSQFDEFLLLIDVLDLEFLAATGVFAGVVLTMERAWVQGTQREQDEQQEQVGQEEEHECHHW